MRFVLLSDVHGNLPALEAVLRDVETRGSVDGVYHLGDLVGYAPWPNEVVSRLRSAEIGGVSGNYDTTVATHYKHCGCRSENPHQEELAHKSFTWTLANTSDDTKRYLGGLPFRLDVRPFGGHQAGPTIRLLHGNNVLNTVYLTEDRSDEFLSTMAEKLGAKAGDLIAFGHTHKPWHRQIAGIHFVNTGSVGRPKDGDARAGYVLLEVAEVGMLIEFVRVEYDVEQTAQAIIASDLPDEFADFLRTGGQPSGPSSVSP
ncbi:MAG: metallophosphoesterase family protein [bacterium]